MPLADSNLTPFPVEVLLQISEDVPREDLAQLLRVNTVFHQAFVKALYTRVPSIVLQERSTGNVHCRPPFKKPTYARHVRCLDVPIFPMSCCKVPAKFPALPSLEVIRLNRLYGHKNATGEEELCPLPDGLSAQTVVLRYPHGDMAADEVPRGLLDKAKRLVAFMPVDESCLTPGRSSRFDSILENIEAEIPDCARELTIVLRPTSDADWKYYTLSALIRICDHTRERSFSLTFDEMRTVTIVLADDKFSSADRDFILAEWTKSRAEAEIDQVDASERPEIDILLLAEFLNRKEYTHVLSPGEVTRYFRIAAEHCDYDNPLDELLAQAIAASAKHVRYLERLETGEEEEHSEHGDFDDVYDDFFDEQDYDDDWYENYRLTGDVPSWVLGEGYDDFGDHYAGDIDDQYGYHYGE